MKILEMCSADLLFWLNAYGTVHEPRPDRGATIKPFISWPFQDIALAAIDDAIGRHDLVGEKCRDMGATWMFLAVMTHRFVFRRMQAFHIMAHKEASVDAGPDPGTLFWKICFIISNLPSWMRPQFDHAHMRIVNHDNGSVFSGSAATGTAGTGTRQTASFMDEFAKFVPVDRATSALTSLQHTTDSNLVVSTPYRGRHTPYAKLVHEDKWPRITMRWFTHPHKARGLYTSDIKGNVRLLDTTYAFPDDYPFVTDGALRSPWYDNEERRALTPQEFAQEVLINYEGSAAQFFDPSEIDRLAAECARPPIFVGDLDYDMTTADPLRFEENRRGRLNLWHNLDVHGRPPRDRSYLLGVDISRGTGASNSVIEVIDERTGEQVAEFASAHVKAYDLAYIAVAIARWYGKSGDPAFMIYECNGEGQNFRDEVKNIGFTNIYYRTPVGRLKTKQTDQPGWWSDNKTKEYVLNELRTALFSGRIAVRSADLLDELRDYIITDKGIEHTGAMMADDPSGARENHGDRVIAAALAAFVYRKRNVEKEAEKETPVGSMAWRFEQLRREEEDEQYYWK